MRHLVFAAAAFVLSLPAGAADAPMAVTRPVQGQTITSTELPAAKLTVAPGLHFVASEHFYLPGRTDVEQFLFADAPEDGLVRRLFWIQFEHKMPENNGTYNYPPSLSAAIDGLSFLYDTKVYTDYAGVKPAAGSDVEHARALLAAHGLHLPAAASRVRMFHAPTGDRRSELMLIYAEALTPDQLPKDAGNDMPADEKYPALSRIMLAHAQGALTIAPD
jgi:hypothetical protein